MKIDDPLITTDLNIFRSMFYNKSLKKVKQLAFTLLTPREGQVGRREYLHRLPDIQWLLNNLYAIGFRKWNVRKTTAKIKGTIKTQIANHLTFVNINAMNR